MCNIAQCCQSNKHIIQTYRLIKKGKNKRHTCPNISQKQNKKKYIKGIQRASVNGEEGSAVVPHLMAGVHILRCQVDALFLLSQYIREFLCVARLLEFR